MVCDLLFRAPGLICSTTPSSKALDVARLLLLYIVTTRHEEGEEDRYVYKSKFNIGKKWQLNRAIATQDLCLNLKYAEEFLLCPPSYPGYQMKHSLFYDSVKNFMKRVS